MGTFTDTFNRDNGALGANWVVDGSLAIVNSQVASSSTPSDAWYVSALDADQTVTITLGVVNGVSNRPQWSLTVRSNTQDVNTSTAYYQAALYFNDPDWLYLIDSSTNSIAMFDVALGSTPAPGDTFSLSAVGSTITLKFNGVTLFTTTDTDIPSGSYAGFSIDQGTVVTEGTVDAAAITAANVVATQTFTPPSISEDPPVFPDKMDPQQTPLGWRLFRFYRARPAGINVYLYKLGSVSATAFGRVTDADPTTTYDNNGNAVSNGWDDIETVFWGGHAPVEVTADQAAALTAAGYTVT